MNARRFINALRIMHSLDRHELVEAGVIPDDNDSWWMQMRDYPVRGAMRLDDERAERLWRLIESRQPKGQAE